MEEVLLHSFETPKRCKMEEEESFINHHTPCMLDGEDISSVASRNQHEASLKRGRPRAEVINHLIIEGSSSGSSIRCETCNRVFPREKSLQAHKRIHTGEKPYCCDYPGCGKAFTQSGQLKTHQRLHTGEKPFICTVAGCNSRFTHANRHCADHPYASLRRCHELALQPLLTSENSPEIRQWLENYKKRNDEKTPGKLSDTNDEAEPSNRIIKKRQIRSKNLDKNNWMTTDPSQQQENIGVITDLSVNNSRPVHRRGKAGIAKALQYGTVSSTGDSSDEFSSPSSEVTVPLYRKLCETVEPSSFGCTPLQWSPKKQIIETSTPCDYSFIRTPVRGDCSSGYESLLSTPKELDSSQENVGVNSTPVRPEKLKRRWLREALTSVPNNANLTRPTVIMTAHKQPALLPPSFEPSITSTPDRPPASLIRALQNAEKQWTGAIALMQLASSPH